MNYILFALFSFGLFFSSFFLSAGTKQWVDGCRVFRVLFPTFSHVFLDTFSRMKRTCHVTLYVVNRIRRCFVRGHDLLHLLALVARRSSYERLDLTSSRRSAKSAASKTGRMFSSQQKTQKASPQHRKATTYPNQ